MDYHQLWKLQRRYDALIFEANQVRRQIDAIERESKEQKQKRLLEIMAKKGIDIDQIEKLISVHHQR